MIQQLSLFDDSKRESPPHSGTQTSREAAERIKPSAATLRAKVLEYIESCGEIGATDEEIQTALSMQGNTQRPRRKELQQAGLIKDSGKTRKTRSGRQASIWLRSDELWEN